MRKLLLIFVFLFVFQHLKSQVIQIGSGSNTSSITTASPVNIYYRRQLSQIVYTVSEINTAGAYGANILSQLGFYITSNPLYNIPGYTIKIKHTNQNNITTALGTTGWTTVKNAFTYAPSPGGFDMIVFDTPFNWNGIQNLAIEICWSQIQPDWDASGQCRIYNSTNSYGYRLDDNTGSICGSSPTTVSNNKPQVQLTFKTTSTWNGAVSSDWFNSNNWDAGVPDSELNAIIPSTATTMPTINSLGAVCKNLEINSGANLTLNGSNEISIYGNWTNNGVFNANTGNVILKGKSTNLINGATNQNLYDLTIDNLNGSSISSGSIRILGSLNIGIATGNFNTNNALTIVSDANGTGRISELTTKCLYTLDMTDSYGDSWNGGFITVLIDGISQGTYFAIGANSTSTFIAPIGSTVQLNYTAGNFENENSYILKDGSGTTIFSDGPTPNTGANVFNTIPNCSFFNPISGNITMQRFVNTGATNWRFFTSAVSGTTLADFNDDFITSGFTGSDYPTFPFTSIYFYDETQPSFQDSGFVAATNISNPVNTGSGLWVWSGDTITGTQPFTVDITGPPNVGDINLPISYTNSGMPTEDGWNMVGNPYPSTINWDSPNINKTGINNAIYIWNPDLQQFASYISGIGTNGGSKNIASSQAFWLQANTVGASVTLTESCKTIVDASFLKQNSIAPLKIKSTNSYGSDELVLNINTNATNTFDAIYDAEKIVSSNADVPSISSILNNFNYSINQFNPQEINIPIKILTGTSGTHLVEFENATLFSNSCLILEDLFTNTSYDLLAIDSFSVFIYDTTQTARFLLHVGAPIDIEINDISCFGNNDGEIIFTKNTATPYDINWLDSLNNILASNNNVVESDTLNNLTNGVYYLETTDSLCGNKIDTVTIGEPSEITAQFSTPTDTVYLSAGGIVNFTNQSINAISFLWDFDDFTTSNLVSPSHQYTQAGTYNVTLNAYQDSSCLKNTSKTIVVLNTVTSINAIDNSKNNAIWINTNTLNVKGEDIETIFIKNILGEVLFSSNNKNTIQQFDLSSISSQILIISIKANGSYSSSKINYIKK